MAGRSSQNGTAHPTFCQLFSLAKHIGKDFVNTSGHSVGSQWVLGDVSESRRWRSQGGKHWFYIALQRKLERCGATESRLCGGQDAPAGVVFHRLLLWKFRACRQGIRIVASQSTVTGGVSWLCSTLRQAQDTALTVVAENVLRAMGKCDTLDCAAFLFPLLAM